MAASRKPNPYKKYCCVYGCMNKSTKESQLTFYNIPRDIERRLEWFRIIDREDLLEDYENKAKYNYVCSAHFDESAVNTIVSTRLVNDAVPTKHLPIKTHGLDATAPRTRRGDIPTYSHSECQTETDIKEEFTWDVPTETKPNIAFIKIEPESAESNENQIQIPTFTESTISAEEFIKNEASNNKNDVFSVSTQTDQASDFTEFIKIAQITSLTDKSPLKRKVKEEIEFVEEVECKKQKRVENDELKTKNEFEGNQEVQDLLQDHFILPESEEEVGRRIMKLISWQYKIKNKVKDNLSDAQYKTFALNLYYASPQSYSYFQKLLTLPSKCTLNKYIFPISTRLDDSVLESISLKLKSMPSSAKYCTLCIDEVPLTRNLFYDIKKDVIFGLYNVNGTVSPELASKAYVIMLQGIYCNWKQPVAYALLGNFLRTYVCNSRNYTALDAWINEVILKLFRAGVQVKAFVSDQGSYFDKYAKVIKNITIEKPYFFIEGHKIFYIFDVPNLFKCLRNDLVTSDFNFQEDIISCDYIKSLYVQQKGNDLKLIPKITDFHIEPNNFENMHFKYTAHFFSNAVSLALETYIYFGKISAEAKGTVKFIKVMNDLFDVLNSLNKECSKNYKSAFRMSMDHKTILEDALVMFANMRLINRRTGESSKIQYKTFHNFQITIQSILQLKNDLNSEGYDYLFTRRLNQDCLDIYFESLKQQYLGCDEPTTVQFCQAFSKLFYKYMLMSITTNSDTVTDIFETLQMAEDIMDKVTKNPPQVGKPSLVVLNYTDYRYIMPATDALTYVAAFLIFKCSEKHPNCSVFKNELASSKNLDRSFQKTFNTYNRSFRDFLKVPSPQLREYVHLLDETFTRNFKHYLGGQPGSEIMKLLTKIKIPIFPCPCFPVDYFLRLFVRLRMYMTLKWNDKRIKMVNKSPTLDFSVKPL